jgi:2-dehydro-3-deoxy-D-arabinonate dehydratase
MSWDVFINRDALYQEIVDAVRSLAPTERAQTLIQNSLLPPIGQQEVWGSGVTYFRSRSARMEESKDAGGGDFYDRVYSAERPELFFKATPNRVVGSGGKVRIRKDSTWDVPEPELTLFITSKGKIVGYTIGNDMSSRSIEGENPLYLPQAKSYDGSTSIGPCLYVPETPLPPDTQISLEIKRDGKQMFQEAVPISQMKRGHEELVSFLFRECAFNAGCFLMTGTGIIPENEFTLNHGDEINISVDHIGTLVNYVE